MRLVSHNWKVEQPPKASCSRAQQTSAQGQIKNIRGFQAVQFLLQLLSSAAEAWQDKLQL